MSKSKGIVEAVQTALDITPLTLRAVPGYIEDSVEVDWKGVELLNEGINRAIVNYTRELLKAKGA